MKSELNRRDAIKSMGVVAAAAGMGVDVNEALAAKYPLPDVQMNNWTQVRKNDDTIIRP